MYPPDAFEGRPFVTPDEVAHLRKNVDIIELIDAGPALLDTIDGLRHNMQFVT